jgi:BirA family transcriptional regulator, biotin operon repressor / biotin---[acetyl-CoA-carboxylase] ligase
MADAPSSVAAAASVATPAPLAHVLQGSSHYDGVSAEEVRHRLGVPRAAVFESLASTMDVAHAMAVDGAPPGTVVLADHQTAGRGRGGRAWQSEAGAGIWLTLIERPEDARAIEVLALRIGLHAAQSLDRSAGGTVGLKWPNDLYLRRRKLAGVLIEARWQDGAPIWVAIGIGINVRVPDSLRAEAAGIDAGVQRLDVLAGLVPELRAAAAMRGELTPLEVAQFAERDIARGRRCTAPAEGRVEGVSASGEIMISHQGVARGYRSGSLVLAGELEGP